MIESLNYAAVWMSISIDRSVSFMRNFGAPCEGGNFLGLPPWYKYLDSQGSGVECSPIITDINDIWLILLAVIEILLRIAALAAVIYVIYGGVKYITARGNSDKLTTARLSVQDALVGVIIAVVAIAVVNFVGSRF